MINSSTWFNNRDTRQTAIVAGLALLILSATSFIGEVYGLGQIHDFNAGNAFVAKTVNHSRERVVVTDTWYAPALLAPIFYDGHLIYLVDTPKQFGDLLDRLSEHGVTQFYYLGSRPTEMCSGLSQCSDLSVVGTPQPMPNKLVGSVYHIGKK